MEEPLLLAGYTSDTDSIRSSVTCSIEVINVRKRSGRKQQAPRRSAFDSESVASDSRGRQQVARAPDKPDYLVTAESQLEVMITAETAGPVSPAVPQPGVQQTAAGASAATAPSARCTKNKQDLAGPCCHCNATSSPQWRKGPKGKSVLCNACGIRFLRNRTLTKVVPKKRCAPVGRDVPAATAGLALKSKRVKTDAAAKQAVELELATDEVLATDETLTVSDDPAAQEAHSHSRSLNTAAGHADLAQTTPSTAVGAAVLQARLQHQQQAAGGSTGTSSCSFYEVHGSPVKTICTGVQQLAAGSTHLLLGANSRMNPSPSLLLALAMHQHQQQEPSPRAGAAGSPVSNTSACVSSRSPRLQSETSSKSPPSSPLVLGGSSGAAGLLGNQRLQQRHVPTLWLPPSQQQEERAVAQQLLPEPSPLFLTGSPSNAAAALGQQQMPGQQQLPGQQQAPGQQPVPGQEGAPDIFQLMQQMATMLGGIGPAVEFIKAMQEAGGAAAMAAAAAASQQ